MDTRNLEKEKTKTKMKEAKPKTVWQMTDQAGNLMSFNHQQYGLFWKWGILFDNGDKGVFNVKDGNQPKFKEGEPASYTIEPSKGDYPHKVTFKDPQYAEQQAPQPTQEFGPPTTIRPADSSTTAVAPAEQWTETPREKQRSIVRQSSARSAALYCATRTDGMLEKTCDAIFEWVMKPESVEAKEIVNDVLSKDFKAAVEADEDDLPF